MEGRVRGVLELRLGQTLVVVDHAIANELHLGNTRNRLQVRVQDGLLGLPRLVVAVAVVLGRRVERLQRMR